MTALVDVQLDLTTAHLMEDDADLRDWRSTVQSLQPIVRPSHVVVIGAGRDERGPGRRILAHLRQSFAGRTSVVHPSAAMIGGIQSMSRISELDTVPDLAMIAVPADGRGWQLSTSAGRLASQPRSSSRLASLSKATTVGGARRSCLP